MSACLRGCVAAWLRVCVQSQVSQAARDWVAPFVVSYLRWSRDKCWTDFFRSVVSFFVSLFLAASFGMEESPSSKSSKSSKSLSGLRGLTSPEIEEILLKLEKLDRRRSNLDEEHPGYGRKMKAIAKKEVALRKQLQVERKRQKLREGFKGAPSSYRHFCFSSAVNRRLRNHQDIEEYNPARQNPFFRKQMQRQRENTVAGRAKRQARLEKQRLKMHEEMEARWKGVPSTTRKLSFSSTANRHIKNEQEYEPVTTYEPDLSSVASPKAHERWGLVPDREDEAEPPVYPGLVHHETPWMGSPSSYQKLSFSSSANRHITRKQAIPGSRVAKTAPRKNEVFTPSPLTYFVTRVESSCNAIIIAMAHVWLVVVTHGFPGTRVASSRETRATLAGKGSRSSETNPA